MENCKFNYIRITNLGKETSSTIYSTYSDGILNDCLFNSNSASYNTNLFYSKPTLFMNGNYKFEECKFIKNKVQGYKTSYCGSLCILASKYFINKCTFYKNSVSSGPSYQTSTFYYTQGGAIFLRNSNWELYSCSFINNTSSVDDVAKRGGAVYIESTTSSFITC